MTAGGISNRELKDDETVDRLIKKFGIRISNRELKEVEERHNGASLAV